MLFALFILIQSQEPPRLSKLVIAAAALFLILGVSLLVYFLRRLKTAEKEAEEDWSLTRRSLFVEPPAPPEQKTAEAVMAEEVMADAQQPEKIEPAAGEILSSSQRRETRVLASEPGIEEPPAHVEPEPALESKTDAPGIFAPPSLYEQEPVREERATELLASQQIETPAHAEATETTPFDEEIWAGLEMEEQESSAPVQPVATGQTTELRSPAREQVSQPGSEEAEPQNVARVERRETQALFEPPTIKPITPREQAEAVRDQQDASKVTRDLYAGTSRDEDRASRPAASDTNLYPRPSERETRPMPQASTLYEQRGTRELAADPGLNPETAPASGVGASVTAAPVNRAHERRAPAGAVLGLPLEGSQGPMVMGDSVRPMDEVGIGSLSSYGKPLVKDGGRGGTIALLLAILIIGGGLAAYLLVPTVHSQVNAWVARARGVDPNAMNQSTEPKAMIFPGLSVPDKNMVKAKGRINNISKETLENLEIEISLDRGNGGPSESRNIPVTPAQIEANGNGTYEFEYDGNRETGFIVYKIKRLLSNGNPVKFTSPGQK